MEKDQSIIDALTALSTRFGDALKIVDNWDADLMAVGVSGAGNSRRLVYFSTFERSRGRYYVDLEFPAPGDSDPPYEQGETFNDVDFETLVTIVARHLALSPL